MFRNAPWSCLVDAALSAAMLVTTLLAGNTYEGKVLTASEGKLMVATDSEQVIIDVPREATVLLDGETATLSDLQSGFSVVVSAEERDARLVASMVTAVSGDTIGTTTD